MERTGEKGGMDYFKMAAACMVAAIHTYPFLSVNKTAEFIFTHILCRVAVPYFFMATGYLVLPRAMEKGWPYLKKYLLKTCFIYTIATIMYLPINIYSQKLTKDLTLLEGIKAVFIDGTFYHLWYLPASITGLYLIWILLKKAGPLKTLIISAFLYAAGLLGDSYYGLTEHIKPLEGVYSQIFKISSYTRNGLFFAPVFLMMGYCIQRKENSFMRRKKILCLCLCLFTLGLTAEGLLLDKFKMQRHDSMYLFLIPVLYCLFLLVLSLAVKPSKGLRELSLAVYIIHPLCIPIVRGGSRLLKMDGLFVENSMLHYGAVLVSSIFLSYVFILLKNKYKKLPKSGDKIKIKEYELEKSVPKNDTSSKMYPGDSRTDRAYAVVHLDNLKWNVGELKKIMPEGCEIMAVLKANAYGHGALAVGKYLNSLGIYTFAAATYEEGVKLRLNGIAGEILILGWTNPRQGKNLEKYDLTQTVLDYEYAKKLNEYGKKVKVHIKIDTGMHRLGEWYEHLEEISKIMDYTHLNIKGIYTHLCVSDSRDTDDMIFTRHQIKHFHELVDKLWYSGIEIPKIHLQSSYGLLNYNDEACDYVRIGIAMYGSLSKKDDIISKKLVLKPVLELKAKITIVKNIKKGEEAGYGRNFRAPEDMKTACVSIGYADGIPRNLKNGSVLVHGHRLPIIGRICMDQLLVGVPLHFPIKQGDTATLIGTDGKEEIQAAELAQKAGTITNEIFSRLGSRLSYIYVN